MKVQLKNGNLREMHPKLVAVLERKGLVTRVLTADAPEEEPIDEPPEVEISPRTGLPKRTYTRRDLKAEG